VSPAHGIDGQDPAIGPNTHGPDQEELDAEHRRLALVGVLELVKRQRTDAVDLVTVVDILGLTEQLDELAGAGRSARRAGERHRRLVAARQAAGLAEAQLDETVGRVE
jgi:hypothetical protein